MTTSTTSTANTSISVTNLTAVNLTEAFDHVKNFAASATSTGSTSTENSIQGISITITDRSVGESAIETELAAIKDKPCFTHGFLLDDRSRRSLQRAEYDGAYRKAVAHAVWECHEKNWVNTVPEGSDLNKIGIQIMHSVLAECLLQVESWKTIPAAYPFRDKARNESGMPVSKSLACRLASMLRMELAQSTSIESRWEIVVRFRQEIDGGCEVVVEARWLDCTDFYRERYGDPDLVLATRELSQAFPKESRWEAIGAVLYGAIALGAVPDEEIRGEMPNTNGAVAIEITDRIEKDTFGEWVKY